MSMPGTLSAIHVAKVSPCLLPYNLAIELKLNQPIVKAKMMDLLLFQDPFKGELRSRSYEGARAANIGRIGHSQEHADTQVLVLLISIQPVRE